MKKSLLSVGVALVMMFGLPMCWIGAASAADKPVKLICTAATPSTHAYGMALEWMRDFLKEKNSTVSLDLQLLALGGEREITEQTIMGSIDIAVSSDMVMSTVMPRIIFSSFPGLFKDYKEVEVNYWKGWIGEEVRKTANENGLVVLDILDNCFRWMTNSKRPITNLDDLKGLGMRVAEVPFLVDFFKELGTVTTPIPYTELSTALQQKIVDGQDNGLISIWGGAFYEFNKFMTPTNHSYSAAIMFMNKEKWDALTQRQKQDVREAALYAGAREREYNMQSNARYVKEMTEKFGVRISEPDPAMMERFIAIGKEFVTRDYYKEIFGPELIAKMYP